MFSAPISHAADVEVDVPTNRRLPGFAWLAIASALAMLILVAIGGAVRATDSGLACPTWPGCFSGGDFLPALQFNVWLEHTHRLVAGVVGLLVAAQLIWALLRYRGRRVLVMASGLALVAVLIQAGLGALVVLNLLRAELVTAHLGMGMLVVATQVFIAATSTEPQLPRVDRSLARLSLIAAGATLLQILVGGHVTGIAAGLVFVGPDFPFLGIASFAPAASEQAWFNIAHRVLAVAVLAAVGILSGRTRKSGATGWLARLPRIAAYLVAVQVLLGVANLATELSAVTVIPHLAVASWIWAVLVLQTTLAYRAAGAPPTPVVEQRLDTVSA